MIDRDTLTPTEKRRLRVLARDIVDDLFTYGTSQKADRLVQIGGSPERQLGGWGIRPATDRIYKHLCDRFAACSTRRQK